MFSFPLARRQSMSALGMFPSPDLEANGSLINTQLRDYRRLRCLDYSTRLCSPTSSSSVSPVPFAYGKILLGELQHLLVAASC